MQLLAALAGGHVQLPTTGAEIAQLDRHVGRRRQIEDKPVYRVIGQERLAAVYKQLKRLGTTVIRLFAPSRDDRHQESGRGCGQQPQQRLAWGTGTGGIVHREFDVAIVRIGLRQGVIIGNGPQDALVVGNAIDTGQAEHTGGRILERDVGRAALVGCQQLIRPVLQIGNANRRAAQRCVILIGHN